MTRAALRIAWATTTDLADVSDNSLQPAELERAGRYKSELRRRQHTGSRAMLRALLAEHTGQPALSFGLTASERGKPVCVGGPAVSISHSGDVVACALLDSGELGIDIEFPGRARDVSGIAERYFAPAEADWLATQPADRFYMLWVLKEAWLKATGAGIAGGLDKLRCTVTPPRIDLLTGSTPVTALQLHALGDGLLGIATLETQPASIQLQRWIPSQDAFIAQEGPELLASHSAG